MGALQNQGAGRWVRLGRSVALIVLVTFFSGCDPIADTREAIRLRRHQITESISATRQFLKAAARNDTSAMNRLATDTALVRFLANQTVFREDIAAAAVSIRPFNELVGVGAVQFEFTYSVGSERRIGFARVRLEEGTWKVSQFSFLAER